CHCGHSEDQHDEVAARYCKVTLSQALRRTCTCPVGPAVTARSYDRR
ncbi:MAG TPA: RGCVC family protein, partial [Sporichthya sp.]|nr:RGCVC family protein [Sporichthya sp.]